MKRIILIVALLISIPLLTLTQEVQDINKYNERKSTQLIEAVMLQDTNRTNYLISAGADVNLKDYWNSTALHYAATGCSYNLSFAQMGRVVEYLPIAAKLVKILIAAGADVNVVDSHGQSPLSYSAEIGTTEIPKLLLDANADVNLKGARSALSVAISCGSEETARLILDKGADIYASVVSGAAKRRFSLDFIKALHAKGADLNHTALYYFTQYALGSPETVQYLISNGADPNTLDDQGNILVANTFVNNILNQPVLDILLKTKPNLNIKNNKGQNILGYLANVYNMDTVIMCNLIKQFVAAGADLNSVDNEGCTPLMAFVKNDNLKLSPVLEFIAAGTDLNKMDGKGNTALSLSVKAIFNPASPEVVMALLQKTDSINREKTKVGLEYSTFIWACDKGQTEIVRLFIKKGAYVNMVIGGPYDDLSSPLIFASCYGHPEVVKLLIQAKANVNKQSGMHKFTALMFAARQGHTDVVKILLAAKANAAIKDLNGQTALTVAVKAGKADIVKLLLPAVPNPILLGNLLLEAVLAESPSMVKMLIDSKANVNLKKKDGYTALLLSIGGGQAEFVRLLIAAKADVNYKAPDGYTPLSAAKESGIQEIIDMLVKAGAK